MSPEDALAVLNRWAVVEYHADPEDNKQWNRVYINIPTTMDGKSVSHSPACPRKLLEVLAESLVEAEGNGAKMLPEEVTGNTSLGVDQLPERWQASRRRL